MAIKSKKIKSSSRDRRKLRIRKAIVGNTDRVRLCIFRSGKHTYAQVVDDMKGITLASSSTLDKHVMDYAKNLGASEELKDRSQSSKGVVAAKAVGMVLAERCIEKKIEKVVFDRSGFLYHGRVQAIADGAREKGLKF